MTLHNPLFLALGAVTLLLAGSSHAAAETCVNCHDFSAGATVPAQMESNHGYADEGCAACHGPSIAHAERPAMTSPDISFGPRWSVSSARQDDQCLACHADNVAEHWQDALHMANTLTCVTCHDLHTDNDKALNPHTQADVCTTCHKAQKRGIHALEELNSDNPACTTCHNPHADQRPVGTMLANRSQGCRTCHNLAAMQGGSLVSAKARSDHKVMVQKDRTCLDCHRGVAHGPVEHNSNPL